MQRSNPAAEGPGQAARPAGATYGEEIDADLCIIGAGSGGLSLAAAAAQLGLAVVLVEKHKMGGDCLNYGCVPSKALIAAARRAHLMRTATPFGIGAVEPVIEPRQVAAHVRGVIDAIAPNDSVERFTGLGVRVLHAPARFADRATVVAGDKLVRARRFCLATGSSPLIPPIQGLDQVPYFTNETIFDNERQLPHLLIIGGGPIGLEMAQAHARLGSRVTVLEAQKALPKDDPELAAVVLAKLRAEGVTILEGAKVESVQGRSGAIRLAYSGIMGQATLDGTHLLIAAGRKPNVQDLNLEAAGIKYDKRGIQVSKALLTSNPRVFAIGDVAGGPQFTHVANYHAGIVLKRFAFRAWSTVDPDIVPWVTFTAPELANVGLTEEQARARGAIRVYRWPFHENDRAQAERATEGFVKVITDKNGRVIGAGIVGEHAGELIHVWALAVAQRLKITAMTTWIAPYPTFGEVNKRAALGYYALLAGSPLVRKVIGLLRRLG